MVDARHLNLIPPLKPAPDQPSFEHHSLASGPAVWPWVVWGEKVTSNGV